MQVGALHVARGWPTVPRPCREYLKHRSHKLTHPRGKGAASGASLAANSAAPPASTRS